jgi:predicted RNA-binding protein YlxR (DUF448 family)
MAASATADSGERTRRCILSGEREEAQGLLRFAIGPGAKVVPDVSGDLPGRGYWLTPTRAAVREALSRRAFAKAARQPVTVDADLADVVERLLTRRCLDLLGLARRAGVVTVGFEPVRAALRAERVGVLVAASDGAQDGRGKLRALAPGLRVVEAFTVDELGLALGRENVVHAALAPGRVADRFYAEVRRLGGFRPEPERSVNE